MRHKSPVFIYVSRKVNFCKKCLFFRSEPESSVISTARSDETQLTENSNVSQQSNAKKPPALKGKAVQK